MDLLLLGLAWTVWCALHSLLIHPPVESRLQRLLGERQGAYRLLYNLFALISLGPVGLIYLQADATPLLIWPAWLRPLQWLCWLAAAALLVAGARVYDADAFLGLRQLRQAGPRTAGAAGNSRLRTGGVLRYSRHPWYLAGLLLLWSRSLTARDLVTSVLLTIYLLIGIRLEERKLIRQFGREYRNYRSRVPMLWGFPRKRMP